MMTASSETLIDTHAWIELFQGTPPGEKVEALLKERECFTSIVSFSEISNWCSKNGFDPKQYIDYVKDSSDIVGLDEEIAVKAGLLRHALKLKMRRWGMIDAIIYTTAVLNGFVVLSGDPDFEGLPSTEML